MNQTRIDWSERLHCCQGRSLELLGFWIATGIAICITAIFYCTMFFDTRRRERIQFIPNDLMPYDRSNEAHASNDTLIESMEHIAGPSASFSHTNNLHIDPEKLDNSSAMHDNNMIDVPIPPTSLISFNVEYMNIASSWYCMGEYWSRGCGFREIWPMIFLYVVYNS